MTDPFSISIGVLTIVQVAGQVCKQVKQFQQLRNKEYLLSIHNECSDLRAVFAPLAKRGKATEESKEKIYKIIEETLKELNEITKFFDAIAKEVKSSKGSFKSFQIKEIKRHIQALQRIKSDLVRLMVVHLCIAMHENLELSAVQLVPPRHTGDELTNDAIEGDSSLKEPPRGDSSSAQTLMESRKALLDTSDPEDLVYLECQRRDAFSCVDNCRCQCHHFRGHATPNFLNQLIGRLFVGYFGLPLVVPACNTQCKRRSPTALKIVYCFPKWVFAYTGVFVRLNWGRTTFRSSLQTTNIVPHDATIFHVVDCGDLESTFELLNSKRASVFDVDCRDGRSVLHTAANMGRFTLCERLLHAGADPLLEDYNHISPLAVMLEKYLTVSYKREVSNLAVDKIVRLFLGRVPNDEMPWDTLNLSPLHKIVAKITNGDLATAASVAGDLLNQVDFLGNTPLLWAVKRGDAPSVKVLVNHGANVTIADKANRTPLHYIGRCGDPQLANELIEHGANIHAKSIFGSTPLHFAAVQAGDDPALTCILLQRGAEIEELNNQQRTILSEAAKYDREAIASLLLEQGANINHMSAETIETPLMEAVIHNSHKCLRLLLSHDAQYSKANREGHNIIHLAALSGDVETLGILAKHGLKNIDVDQNTESKRNVKAIISDRIEHKLIKDTERWTSAMNRLLASIQPRDEVVGDAVGLDGADTISDEVFFDAVAWQED